MLVWDDEVKTSRLQSAANALGHSSSARLQEHAFEPATPIAVAASPSASDRRVKAADKRIINGQTDVNQLVPFKYKWAWEKYLATCANHWMPQEINMSRDMLISCGIQ